MRVDIRRKALGLIVAISGACLAVLIAAPLANAFYDENGVRYGAEIVEYKAVPSETQAGGHPDLFIRFKVGTKNVPQNPPGTSHGNSVKEALVQTPAGFIGYPTAVPACTTANFALDLCPPDSQVGYAEPGVELQEQCVNNPETCEGVGIGAELPIYNLTPAPDQAALAGFKAPFFGYPTYTEFHARTDSDFGLDARVSGIASTFPLRSFNQYLWGIPASPVHDPHRYEEVFDGYAFGPNTPSTQPERPFLSSPTVCSGPLESTFTNKAYDGVFTSQTSPWPEVTGCDILGFDPSLAALPSTTEADTAAGVDILLRVPQPQSPVAPSDSQIRDLKVTFPEGFSINPNAADGKVACSDAEAKFGTTEEAQCPEFSTVGTLELTTPQLPVKLPGAIYLGEPRPGNQYRLFLTADGQGTHIKLPGYSRLNPETGRVEFIMEDLPQSPFSEFDMHFFGSERALFATPTRCGEYSVDSVFTPWDDQLPDQESSQLFEIKTGPGGAPCPGQQRPFNPGFRAVGQGNGAGLHSSFSVEIGRADGDQGLKAVTVKTPPGFLATLKGIPYCSDAALARAAGRSGREELASPSCPPASRVGTSYTGTGAGTHPLYSAGNIYLAGPYKGAPLSLAIITPSVSGPYDIGNPVVRTALNVDPETAQITAVSDPLPTILGGIPLRIRSLQLDLDRDNFILNPTNCDPLRVEGTVYGLENAESQGSNHFQVGNCGVLDYRPRLSLNLTGGLARLGHPAIHAVLRAAAGEANTSRVSVALPKNELLDQSHIDNVCTRVQFAAGQCPSGSVLGTAEARTPLLDAPLKGNAYLRTSPDGGLPNLVVDLRGQIGIVLVGRIDTVNGGALRTTFAGLPDAPIEEFKLDLLGGKKGLIQNSKPVCGRRLRAQVKMVGQNAARNNVNPLLKGCGNAKAKKGKKAKRGRH
jgi:hypothetical protein